MKKRGHEDAPEKVRAAEDTVYMGKESLPKKSTFLSLCHGLLCYG